MARSTYRTALRAKGIRPIPKYEKLRSYRGNTDGKQHIICARGEGGAR
jgi:hypothetical protein